MDGTVASQQGHGFETRLRQGQSVQSLHVLPTPAWALSAYSGFLPQVKDIQATYSKLPVGVSVSVKGCL